MATKKTKDNAVAEIDENTALSNFVDYGTDFEDGTDTDESEKVIPFLKILQAQSREIHPAVTIEGAVPGLILNTASQELMSSVHFIPVYRDRKYVEWSKSDEGETGTVIAKYDPLDPMVVDAVATQKFGDFKTPAGNELAETFYLYGITVDEDGNPKDGVCISFASTQIKHWKKGIKRRIDACTVPAGKNRKAKPPIYAHQLLLTTGPESKGTDHWKGWVPKFFVNDNVKESLLTPDSPLYQAGKQAREDVINGVAKIDDAQAEGGKTRSEDADSPF